MLRALLLAACLSRAAPDWVEISQHHYNRVPTHHHQEQTWRDSHPARHHEDDFQREIYSNYSITEHNWNRDAHRVPGSIKRVNTNFKRSNVTPEFSLDVYEQVTEIEPEVATKYIRKGVESVPVVIERVPNKGSVKRVQLSHTPVKSPSVTEITSPIRRNDLKFYGTTETDEGLSDEFEVESDSMFNDKRLGVAGQTFQTHIKHFVSNSNKTPFTNYNRRITSTDVPNIEPSITPHRLSEQNHNKKDSTNENITTEEENLIPGTHGKKTLHTKPLETIDTNKDETVENVPKFVKTMNSKINRNEFEEVTIGDDVKDNANAKENNTRQRTESNLNKTNNDESIKANTMENVMNFVKVVADTISKNARRGVGGKVEYLNELKQTLLCTIQDRIDATWPDDGAKDARAQRRSRSAAARGHVEFPSSESSLMTISFLTFAVFLIKLVLQIIHTYKNKAMMVAPLVLAASGRTVRKLRNFQ